MAIALPSDAAEMPVDAIPGEGFPIAAPSVTSAPAAPQEIDNLMTLASAPPPVVPLTPVDAALAPALPPDGGAALPVSPAAASPPPSPVANAAQNVEETRKLGEEQVANAETAAADKAKEAEAKAQFEREREAALQKLQERQEMHRHAAQAEVSAARAKAEGEPYHTFWENRSIAQNVATGIGLILSGVSWNPAHTNRGVDILNKAMDQDLAIQKEKHANLWRAVNEAQDGQRALDTTQLRELSAFSAAEGAKWDRVSTQLAAAVAMNKGKGDVTAAKKAAVEANEKANTFYEHATSAAATASHLDEQEKELARHHLEQEKTAAVRAAKYKAKGAGGGGNRSALESAAITLGEEIAAARDAGKPLSQPQIDRRAVALKIPLVGRPNTINAREIAKGAAKEASDENRGLGDVEKRAFRDESGKVVGTLPNAKAVVKFEHDDAQLTQAAQRLQDLADDIRRRPTVSSPKEIGERAAKYANAIIAVATTSPLGKTNESIHQESASIGLSGAIDPDHLVESIKGILAKGGANPDIVAHKAKESVEIRNAFRRQTVTPLTPEQEKHFNRSGGTDDDAMRAAAERVTSGKSPASDAAKKRAQEWLDKHPKKADVTL